MFEIYVTKMMTNPSQFPGGVYHYLHSKYCVIKMKASTYEVKRNITNLPTNIPLQKFYRSIQFTVSVHSSDSSSLIMILLFTSENM